MEIWNMGNPYISDALGKNLNRYYEIVLTLIRPGGGATHPPLDIFRISAGGAYARTMVHTCKFPFN